MWSLETLRLYRKLAWKYNRWTKEGTTGYIQFKRIENTLKILNGKWYEEWEKFEKIVQRRKASKKRYKKYLESMMERYCDLYWVTFTISDKYIKKDCKRKLNEYLKEHAKDWLVNEDYGKEKGRLHFHGVIATKDNVFTWKYGNINVRKIDKRKGTKKITAYANKLTNHALKDGAGVWWHPRGIKEIETSLENYFAI